MSHTYGVDTVIDVVNVTTQSRRRAVEFFRASTANLLRAEERAGVGHHLTLSIVGIDRVDTGYYAGKLRQEEVVAGGAVELPPLGAAATAAARGALLPEGTGPRGTETFEQWLACTGGRPNPGMTEPAVGVVR